MLYSYLGLSEAGINESPAQQMVSFSRNGPKQIILIFALQ